VAANVKLCRRHRGRTDGSVHGKTRVDGAQTLVVVLALDDVPPGRAISVRSSDGVRLHAEVFGPDDGYPIVLAHGITCAIRVWMHQITDLPRDHRVIAFDHRGHGRSDVRCTGGSTPSR
jgi:hypothetical protein